MDGNVDYSKLSEKYTGVPMAPKPPNDPPVDFARLLREMRNGTSSQESGGNNRAINPDSAATGRFQVMPANIGRWTEKHLGRRMSRQEFLASPEAQVQVFDLEMGEYLREAERRLRKEGKKLDPTIIKRMGAAAWYGGLGNMHRYDDDKPQYYRNPRTGRRVKYPSFRSYTTSVAGTGLPDLQLDFEGLNEKYGVSPEDNEQYFAELTEKYGFVDEPDDPNEPSPEESALLDNRLKLADRYKRAKTPKERDALMKRMLAIDAEIATVRRVAKAKGNLPPVESTSTSTTVPGEDIQPGKQGLPDEDPPQETTEDNYDELSKKYGTTPESKPVRTPPKEIQDKQKQNYTLQGPGDTEGEFVYKREDGTEYILNPESGEIRERNPKLVLGEGKTRKTQSDDQEGVEEGKIRVEGDGKRFLATKQEDGSYNLEEELEAPKATDEDYRQWLDYKNRFEKAGLQDSAATRAQFDADVKANNQARTATVQFGIEDPSKPKKPLEIRPARGQVQGAFQSQPQKKGGKKKPKSNRIVVNITRGKPDTVSATEWVKADLATAVTKHGIRYADTIAYLAGQNRLKQSNRSIRESMDYWGEQYQWTIDVEDVRRFAEKRQKARDIALRDELQYGFDLTPKRTKELKDKFGFTDEELTNAKYGLNSDDFTVNDEMMSKYAEDRKIGRETQKGIQFAAKEAYKKRVDARNGLGESANRYLAQLEGLRDAGIGDADSLNKVIKAEEKQVRTYLKEETVVAAADIYAGFWEAVGQIANTAQAGSGAYIGNYAVNRQSYLDGTLTQAYEDYGSVTELYAETRRIRKKYGAQGPIFGGGMAAPNEFARNFGRYIAKLPGKLLKAAAIGNEFVSQAVGIDNDATLNPLYQWGKQAEEWVDSGKNQDFKHSFVINDVSEAIAQVVAQGVGFLLVGPASLALPLIEAGEAQYAEAHKAGATPLQRFGATTIGGVAAIPDALLKYKFLRHLKTPGQRLQFIENLTSSMYTKISKFTTEQQAKELTRRGVMGYMAQLGKNVAVGGTGEFSQEAIEDVINKTYKKLTYEPDITWKDVFVPNRREIRGYAAAGIAGIFGGSVETVTQRMNSEELFKADHALRTALQMDLIDRGDAVEIMRAVEASMREKLANGEISEEDFEKELTKARKTAGDEAKAYAQFLEDVTNKTESAVQTFMESMKPGPQEDPIRQMRRRLAEQFPPGTPVPEGTAVRTDDGKVEGVVSKDIDEDSVAVEVEKPNGTTGVVQAQKEDLTVEPEESMTFAERMAARKNRGAYIEEKTKPPREFSSTQVNLEDTVARKVQKVGTDLIDEADLSEEGRETKPHITVKFGLETNDVKDIEQILADVDPFTVKLGKTSSFPDSGDGEVVKVDVESKELREINQKIAELPNGDKFKDYKPHLTLAYVKPGKAKKYVGDSSLEGTEIKFDSIAFSTKDRKMIDIPLGGTASKSPGLDIVDNSRKFKGQTEVVTTPDGTEATVTGVTVDQSDIITSFDPEYPPELQPRDRDRKASKAQIEEITTKLDPNQVSDSPLAGFGRPLAVPVTVDGQQKFAIVSGNARTAGIKGAYDLQNKKSEKYRQFANKKGKTQKNHPVYIGVLDPNEVTDLPQFAREANKDAVARMSTTEQAVTDAKSMNPALLAKFAPTDDGAVTNAGNRDFVRGFIESATSATERTNLFNKNGVLNQAGVQRIKNAVFAFAYGAEDASLSALQRLTESTDSNIRRVTTALLKMAGPFASLKQAIAEGKRYEGLDITNDLIVASEKAAYLRDNSIPVEQFLKQQTAFGEELTPFQNRLVQVFDVHKNSETAIVQTFQNYIDIANGLGDPAQPSMFGDEVEIDAPSFFKSAVETYEESILSEDQERTTEPEISETREKDSEAEALLSVFDGATAIVAQNQVAPAVERVLERYNAELPKFHDFITGIDSKLDLNTPSKWIPKKLKGKDRIVEKTLAYKAEKEEDTFNVAHVQDIMRATLHVNSQKELNKIFREFKGNVQVLREKNRFVNPLPSGYSDILLNIDFNGAVAELQLHIPEILDVKLAGHTFYEEQRVIEEKAVKEDRDFTPEEWERRLKLIKNQERLYLGAREDFTNRTNVDISTLTPSAAVSKAVRLGGSELNRTIVPPPSAKSMTATGTPSTSKRSGEVPGLTSNEENKSITESISEEAETLLSVAEGYANITREAVKGWGFADNILPNGNIKVFHGTSKANARSIESSGEFQGFPFFALDRETAQKYANQTGSSNTVMEFEVDAGSVLPTGGKYLSARVDGFRKQEDGSWSSLGNPVYDPAETLLNVAKREELERLALGPTTDLLSDTHTDQSGGVIRVDAKGHERYRRILEEVRLRRQQIGKEDYQDMFGGMAIPPRDVADLHDLFLLKAKELDMKGYSKEESDVFRHDAEFLQKASAAGNGIPVVYIDPNVLPEEIFHAADLSGALVDELGVRVNLDDTSTFSEDMRTLFVPLGRHSEPAPLDNHPVKAKLWQTHFSHLNEYKRIQSATTLNAVLRAEIAPFLMDKSDKELKNYGITPDQADDYLLKWFELYAEKNGIEALDNFEREELDVQTFIEKIKDARTQAEVREEGQTDEKDSRNEGKSKKQTRGSPETAERVNAPFGNTQRYASLPRTLRRAGIEVEDMVYEVFGDIPAQLSAQQKLIDYGVDGSVEYLRTRKKHNMDADDAILSFMIQRIKLNEAQTLETYDPKAAAAKRQEVQELANAHAYEAIRAGRFTRAASIIAGSTESVIYTASMLVQKNFNGDKVLSPRAMKRLQDKAEKGESALALLSELTRAMKEEVARRKDLEEKIANGTAEAPRRTNQEKRKRLIKRVRAKSKTAKKIPAKRKALLKKFGSAQTQFSIKGGKVNRAPNGKPSNLSPHLYQTVRTPEFKAWFGDWENDPDNASKVVDENGEPRVVYHGTGLHTSIDSRMVFPESGIEEFDPNGAIYFSSDTEEASLYTTGFDVDGDTSIRPQAQMYPVFLNIRSLAEAANVEETYIDPDVTREWEDADFDGVTYQGDERAVYVAKEPNQIKSVFNRGDFSNEDAGILFSSGPTLTDQDINDLGEVGAENLINGLAGETDYKPDDFHAEMVAEFGDVVLPYMNEIYAKAWETRNQILNEMRLEQQRESIKAQYEEELTEDEIDAILEEQAKARQRQADILKLHRVASGAKSRIDPDLVAEIADKAKGDDVASTAMLVAHGRSATQIYRNLEQNFDIRGKQEQRKILTTAENIVSEAKETLRNEAQARLEAVAKGQENVDVSENASKQRAKVTRSRRAEIKREIQRQTVQNDYAEELEDWEIDLIVDANNKAEQRRRAIERQFDPYLNPDPVEQSKPKVNGQKREELRIIAELAKDQVTGIVAGMFHVNAPVSSIYKFLKSKGLTKQSWKDFKGGKRQRKIWREAEELRQKARQQRKNRIRAMKEEVAGSDAMLQEIEDKMWKQRRAYRDAQFEIQKELRRIGKGEAAHYGHVALDVTNAMRTYMAMLDLSAVLRQGGFFSVSSPELQMDAITGMLKSITEKGYGRTVLAIEKNPYFRMAQEAGIDFAIAGKGEGGLTEGEELFRSEFAEKIPLMGDIAKVSERTYSAFLDMQRMIMFEAFATQLESDTDGALDFFEDPKEFKQIAKFINVASGRGTVPGSKLFKMLMDLPLFAPRYTVSRFQLINMTMNPRAWMNMPPQARKIILKKTARFYGTMTAIMTPLFFFGAVLGITIQYDDPEDADWLKIVWGNTSFDPWIGMVQPARLLARLALVEYETAGGDRYSWEYFNRAGGALGRFVRGKLSPIASLFVDWKMGTNYNGELIDWASWNPKENPIISRLIPLTIQDGIDAGQLEGPSGIAKSVIPNFFGVGANTYERNPEKLKTDAERLSMRILMSKIPKKPKTRSEKEMSRKVARLAYEVRNGSDEALNEARRLHKDGEITDGQFKRIKQAQSKTNLESIVSNFTPEELEQVIKVATPAEKALLDPIYMRKVTNKEDKDLRAERKVNVDKLINRLQQLPKDVREDEDSDEVEKQIQEAVREGFIDKKQVSKVRSDVNNMTPRVVRALRDARSPGDIREAFETGMEETKDPSIREQLLMVLRGKWVRSTSTERQKLYRDLLDRYEK